MREHRGAHDASGMRIGIVASRFGGDPIIDRLLAGAVDALVSHGASRDYLVLAWVPGSFEIPLAARAMAEHAGVDAVVCLGVVIRGDTPHFDYVAGEAARGIAAASTATGVPVTFGVLTTDTVEQAMARAGGSHGNKGADAALAAVEMVSVLRSLRGAQPA